MPVSHDEDMCCLKERNRYIHVLLKLEAGNFEAMITLVYKDSGITPAAFGQDCLSLNYLLFQPTLPQPLIKTITMLALCAGTRKAHSGCLMSCQAILGTLQFEGDLSLI